MNALRLWKCSGSNILDSVKMLTKNFKEFLELLNKNQVDYLIVGGYVVTMHGYPRYTGDLDIWINATPD